jgi:hypothetical protein
MARTVFALALIQTSQGWVEPACPLPANDIPEEELKALHDEGKVVSAEHDSPLAARAHEIRRSGDSANAPAFMAEAARTTSPDSPEQPTAPHAEDETREPTTSDNSPQTTTAPAETTEAEPSEQGKSERPSSRRR